MKKLSILIVSMLFTFHTYAGGLDANQIYLGGGLSLNDYGFGDDATGYQIFVGMPIPVKIGAARLLGEVGYMNAGEVDVLSTPAVIDPFTGNVIFPAQTVTAEAKGLWANAVVELPVAQNVNLLGRIGLDFGDDDGLMIGGGVGIPVGKKVDLRFEYVIRDNIDSLQANLTFEL